MEHRLSSDPTMCGELKFSMYGTRDAAANWEDFYSLFLMSLGFIKGKSSPCVFHSKEKGIKLMVHGDDFVAIGTRGA